MTRRQISSGSPFEKAAGYSRALIDRDMCFVSGTTGYDYSTMVMPEEIETQTQNALDTIAATLNEAGFDLADVVRANYIITNAEDAEKVFAILGQSFGDIRPAATMIVAGLIKPEMKIEIEVTARKA